MRKFSEIQEWKYQKKKKPLVFLQEDIEERELLIQVLKKRSIGYLNARRLQVEAKIESANRPKGVLLKYKELVREAQRDEATLVNLENQFRLNELNSAKFETPWELITRPTLLKGHVTPNKKKIQLIK